MTRTEKVTLTNMCMIYDETRVLVQEKVDKNYEGITFSGDMLKKFNRVLSFSKCSL